MMNKFLDYVGLWVSVNMIAWFTLWWTYDKEVTWSEEFHLLVQTSIGATAITLAVWGVTRASQVGSAVPRKYSQAVESALDQTLKISDNTKEEKNES